MINLILLFFRAGWNLLQDLIQSRTKKLSGAYEIHKFNRDAKEILGRVKVHSFMCTIGTVKVIHYHKYIVVENNCHMLLM